MWAAADVLDVVPKGDICTTNKCDVSPYLHWGHSVYGPYENELSKFLKEFQRVVLQNEGKTIQGCSQRNWELLSYCSWKQWREQQVRNSSLLTSLMDNHQLIAIAVLCYGWWPSKGSESPSKQSQGLKHTDMLPVLSGQIFQGHTVSEKSHRPTMGSLLAYEKWVTANVNHLWVFWPLYLQKYQSCSQTH